MIKIVKIILEKQDIENLIKAEYKGAEIVSGLENADMEIVIKIEKLVTSTPVKPHEPEIRPPLPPSKGTMGRTRDNMKVF